MLSLKIKKYQSVPNHPLFRYISWSRPGNLDKILMVMGLRVYGFFPF
jgi:hypothetical protein